MNSTNIDAICYLGDMYFRGLGTERNITMAKLLLDKGKSRNDARCINTLGLLYPDAPLVETPEYPFSQNKPRAYDYFTEAAKLGSL